MTKRRETETDPVAELREATREAHGVIKDMERLLAEFRVILRTGAEQARTAAQEAATAEMGRWQDHIQAEMDRAAKDLNQAVTAARMHIIKQLTVSSLEPGPDGKGLMVRFTGNLFDDGSGEVPGD